MSDGIDPFTRCKMTLADVKDVPDLKDRIDAWVAERLASRPLNPSPPPPYPSQ